MNETLVICDNFQYNIDLAFYEKKLKAEKEMKTINPPNNTWGANRYTENK
jgi:hypothetical protein